MKSLLLSALGVGVVAWTIYKHWQQQQHVTPHWLNDHARRQWGIGIDQVCSQSWPWRPEEKV